MEDSKDRYEQRGKENYHGKCILWEQHNAMYNTTFSRLIRSQSGMTVIELLIALLIMIVVINMALIMSDSIGKSMLKRNVSNRELDKMHSISTQMTSDLFRTTVMNFDVNHGIHLTLSDKRVVIYSYDNHVLKRNNIPLNPETLLLKNLEFVLYGAGSIQSYILGRSSIPEIPSSQLSLVEYSISSLDDKYKLHSAVYLRQFQKDSPVVGY